MKKLMRVCLSVFMAVVMIFGNFSFAASSNSSARNTYMQLEKNNFDAIKKAISKSEILFDTNFNTSKEKIEIYGENLPGDFNNLKLTAIGETDTKNNYQYAKVSLGSKQYDKLSFELILKDKTLMMQVPELYEKYINIDLSKLKEICDKFGVEITEEEISSFNKMLSDSQEGLILSKQDEAYLKKVAPKYVKKLNSLLGSKYFVMENNDNVEYNYKSIECKSVSLEITLGEIVSITQELLKDLRKDEKLLDILVRIANYGDPQNMTKEELTSSIDDFNQVPTDNDELSGIKFISKLYYNTQKETLKREIKLVNVALNEEMGISLTTISGDYYELDLGTIKFRDYIVESDKKVEHNIRVIQESFEYVEPYSGADYYEEVPYTQTENFKIVIETLDKNNTVITCSQNGMSEKLIIKVRENVSTNKKLDCNLEFIVDTNEVDYKLFMNCLIEKDVKITPKKFTNAGIDLYKISEEELMEEIQNNEEKVTKKAEDIMRELFPEAIRELEEEMMMNSRATEFEYYEGNLNY